MSTDTLTAIINIINSETVALGGNLKSASNRANLMGDALEEYIQEAYSGTIDETNREFKLKRIDDVFSYTGNNSNPPDGMIKGGEAIEVRNYNLTVPILSLSYTKATLDLIAKLLVLKNGQKKILYILSALLIKNQIA